MSLRDPSDSLIVVAEVVNRDGATYTVRTESIAETDQAAAEETARWLVDGYGGKVRRIEVFGRPRSIWQPLEMRPWEVRVADR